MPSPNYFCYACNLSWKFKKIKKLLTSFIRPSYNVTISVVKKGSKVGRKVGKIKGRKIGRYSRRVGR